MFSSLVCIERTTNLFSRIPHLFRYFCRMKVLVLDNYDSFTYNLVQMIELIVGNSVSVFKNDEISMGQIEEFDNIVLSPGPGIPSEAGIMLDVIKHYAGKKPIFGVCLGLQAIVETFGGSLINLKEIYHGVATESTQISEHKIFRNLPEKLEVGRYHSWASNPDTFPEDLIITSIDNDGMIMSLKHIIFDIHAVQYHPESILTPFGKEILKNFFCD